MIPLKMPIILHQNAWHDCVKVDIYRPPYIHFKAIILSEKTAKFEIYKDSAGKFRFRLKAPNGEIIAYGEAYESKDSCKNGIESVKTNAPKAEIVDTTE